MTTTTTSQPEAIAAIVRGLMNGEALPHAGSEAFDRITTLVGGFLKTGTTADQARLGVLTMGLLIDAARAKIQTDQVLANYGKDVM